MASKSWIAKQARTRDSELDSTVVVKVVAGREGIFVSLNCVVSVFASSPAPVKFLAFERQVGRELDPSAPFRQENNGRSGY